MTSIEAKKAYRQRNPEKSRIIVYAQRYVPLKDYCQVCGAKKSEGARLERHHADYSKPLDVITICRSCHKKIPTNHNINIDLSNRYCGSCSKTWPECGKSHKMEAGEERVCSLWEDGAPIIPMQTLAVAHNCSTCAKSIPKTCNRRYIMVNTICKSWVEPKSQHKTEEVKT